jgi:hypothetical protein
MTGRIDNLTRRVEPDPLFLASALADYARSEHLSESELAAALGCTTDTLARLRLCLRPRADQFEDDIDEIAERFQIDDVVLAEAVRHSDALQSIQPRPAHDARAGLLKAARDRKPKPGASEES